MARDASDLADCIDDQLRDALRDHAVALDELRAVLKQPEARISADLELRLQRTSGAVLGAVGALRALDEVLDAAEDRG